MKTYTYNNLTVTAERRKFLDAYGNPLYIIKPINFKMVHLDFAHRNYLSKGYYLIQSYNIDDDMIRFMERLDQETRDGWKVDLPANDWDKHYNLVNEMTGQHLLIDINDIDSLDELTNIDLLLQLAWKEVR